MAYPTTPYANPYLLAMLMQQQQQQQSPSATLPNLGPQLQMPQTSARAGAAGGLPMGGGIAQLNRPSASSQLSSLNPAQFASLAQMFRGNGGGTGMGGLLGLFGGNNTSPFAMGGGYSGLLGGSFGTASQLASNGTSFADLLGSGSIAM